MKISVFFLKNVLSLGFHSFENFKKKKKVKNKQISFYQLPYIYSRTPLLLFIFLVKLKGLSVSNFDLNGTSYPLIWGGEAANVSAGANSEIASFCFPGSLNSYKAEGKIILCDTLNDGAGILYANAIGAIMSDPDYTDFAFSYPVPATLLSPEDGLRIKNYIRSTE